MVSLTFDDGPGPTTNRILDILHDYKVLATFFITGNNLVNTPWDSDKNLGWSIGKRILKEGHLLGNHTFSHALSYQNEQDFLHEISNVDTLIVKLYEDIGMPTRKIPVRLPFGVKLNDERLNYLGGLGRSHIHWSNNFNDWHEGPIDSLFYEMINYVESRELIGLNSVLDLHDGGIGNANGYKRVATADATKFFLNESIKRGWIFFQSPL